MRTRILAAFLLAVCGTPMGAVQVTGELFAERLSARGVLTIHGPNFSIRSEFARVYVSISPLDGGICNSLGCGPGDPVPMNSVLSDMGPTSGTIDGIFYPVLSHGDASTDFTSSFFFMAPTHILEDSLVQVVPFTFEGRLAPYLPGTNICLLCQPPLGRPLERPLRISGFGHVTLTLEPVDFPAEGPWMMKSVLYRLEVPEPSSVVLALPALIALGIVRLAQKYRAQRVEKR